MPPITKLIRLIAERAKSSGKTAEEWFLENRYLPAMEAEYKA